MGNTGNILKAGLEGAGAGAALGPWGAAAGAAIGVGAAFFGGRKSAKENNKARQLVQTQRDDNRRWYEMSMAQDYTQRADAQNIINKQRNLLREQYKNSRAANIVAGGSNEQLTAQQQSANESLSNTMTNIAGQAASHKDAIEQQYRQNDAQLNQQQAASHNAQAQQIANATGQAVGAGLELIGVAGNAIASAKGKPTIKGNVMDSHAALNNDIAASRNAEIIKPKITGPTKTFA